MSVFLIGLFVGLGCWMLFNAILAAVVGPYEIEVTKGHSIGYLIMTIAFFVVANLFYMGLI